MDKLKDYGIKVLDKAFNLLSYFYEKEELSLKELVELSGLNRSTVYRIMQAFQKWGFVLQHPDNKKYRLSLKIVEMAGNVLRKMNLINICRPYLLELRDRTGESSFLSILREMNILIIDWEPSYYDVHINVTVGKAVPAYCSGAGKAILAFLAEKDLEELLSKHPLKRYTENTITDKERLLKVLEETRVRGYGLSSGEYDRDIVVAGAPIFDIHNRVIASCAIGALKSRVRDEKQMHEYGKLVKEAASQISKQLGAQH